MGAAFGVDGSVEYRTSVHGFPLPPPVRGRVAPTFNGNSQYRLPHPETGTITSYTRASTVAKTLEDTYMLDAWARRMIVLGFYDNVELFARLQETVDSGLDAHDVADPLKLARLLRTPLNRLAEQAHDQSGAGAAAEFGTATHAWCEWVDLGEGHIQRVPEMFRPWVLGHRRALAESGLTVLGEFTETIVLNTQWGIAGTLDRLFLDSTGRALLGDIKTSRGLEYSWLYFAIQLAIYHGAAVFWDHRTQAWEPMPELDPHTALISHLPREDPEAARIVPISMDFGARALHAAMTVRRLRSVADKSAQAVPYAVGSMDRATAEGYAARFAVETSETEDQLAEVWERYRDIWTDDLTVLGRATLRLASATQRNAQSA